MKEHIAGIPGKLYYEKVDHDQALMKWYAARHRFYVREVSVFEDGTPVYGWENSRNFPVLPGSNGQSKM